MEKQSLTRNIRQFILGNIQDGSWPTDHKIPSEAALMEHFSASRMTVHRTIKELAAEGYVYRERGRGSFVTKPVPRRDLLEISDIAEEIATRSGVYFGELKHLALEKPSPITTHIFGSRQVNTIARSKVIHFENGVPLQLEDRYVNLTHAPDYLDLDFISTTAHQYLIKTAPLQKAEHELTAVLPTPEQQRYLQIQANEPCLLIKRKTWSGGELVSYAELLYPGSRYSFGGEFTPGEK